MVETIVPIFMIHKYILCEGETNEDVLRHLWHRAHDRSTLLTTFHRPTGVTRLLDRLSESTCIFVVACEGKTQRPLAVYADEDWDIETEALWREFLRDTAKVRYLQTKIGHLANEAYGGWSEAEEEKEQVIEDELAESAIA